MSNIAGAVLGFTGRLTPAFAGLLHASETLGIFYNSNRLLKWDIPALERSRTAGERRFGDTES